ncbi:MAG: MarR family transcriptional regulator [Promethearchaeota archaeon]
MDKNNIDTTPKQIFASKIKYRIIQLLYIHQKLTLQEMADKLSRDKSSIHPHVQKLIKMGYIKPPTQVDGNRSFIFEPTKKKANVDRGLDFKSGFTPTYISQVAEGALSVCEGKKTINEETIHFWKNIQKMNKNPEYFEELKNLFQYIFKFELDNKNNFKLNEEKNRIWDSKHFSMAHFFDEDTFKDFWNEFNQIILKYKKIEEEKEQIHPVVQHPVYFRFEFLPLDKIIEISSRKNLN